MIQRFNITQVVEATGLEECEIRFFEQVFREFLTFSQLSLDKNEFSQDHIDVLQRIKRLIHEDGHSIDEVKRELRGALGAGRSAAKPAALTPYTPTDAPSGRFARVIAVTSGKGGVGKTFVTVNLALAFARAGKRVAIFDADLGLANVHILMGVKPKFNLRHMIEDNFSLDDLVTVGPEGVKIISGGQGVREMANLTAEQRRVILRQLDHLEREVDILLIDTGAGISENVLRFATFADEIIVVTTPNIAAAADGYSIIKILLEMEPGSKLGADRQHVPEHVSQQERLQPDQHRHQKIPSLFPRRSGLHRHRPARRGFLPGPQADDDRIPQQRSGQVRPRPGRHDPEHQRLCERTQGVLL